MWLVLRAGVQMTAFWMLCLLLVLKLNIMEGVFGFSSKRPPCTLCTWYSHVPGEGGKEFCAAKAEMGETCNLLYPSPTCSKIWRKKSRHTVCTSHTILFHHEQTPGKQPLFLSQLLWHVPGMNTKQVAEDTPINMYDLQSIHTRGQIRLPLFRKLGYGNCTYWIIKTQKRGILYRHGIYQGNSSCNCSALILSCRCNAKHMKHCY